ncbi:MAG: V4R domain-containing protein [Gemmatimonadaceae bacterium]
MLALTQASLAALRAALMRDAGPAAASYLQEAGFAGGATLFESFRSWLGGRDAGEPEDLDIEEFERHASAYFHDAGWGTLHIGSLRDTVATLDSEDWGEADPTSALEYPGCHLTTGMFADFFGRLAEAPLAVLEVECRSMGAPRCRFLLGSAAVMEHVYDGMGEGSSYDDAVEAVA